jgi:hypothetical protein
MLLRTLTSFCSNLVLINRGLPYPNNQYIYFEGDDITNIYFLIKGKAGFVLPKYKNTTYIEIIVGTHFGIIDIVGSMLQA